MPSMSTEMYTFLPCADASKAITNDTKNATTAVLNTAPLLRQFEHLAHEHFFGKAAHDLDRLVDDRLRHAGEAVLAAELHELGCFNRVRGDLLVCRRHFVCEDDRPRAMRSSRRGKDLDVG